MEQVHVFIILEVFEMFQIVSLAAGTLIPLKLTYLFKRNLHRKITLLL